MSWKLSVISAGTELDLSDGDDYIVTGIDGLASAPISRITETGPMQHGASDRGYRLQPRRIALGIAARGGTDAEWFARRQLLQSILRVSDNPVKLRVTAGESPNQIVRQIDCYPDGEMEMPRDQGLASRWVRAAFDLLAPDPTWYDPAAVAHVFALGGSGQAMDIPLEIPWQIGASAIDSQLTIAYTGTWDAYPLITIEGPITDCVITNSALGDKLDFTGVTIDTGEKRIVDCRYGYKSVVDESGANCIADLTAASNLATFRIGAHPDIPAGANSLRVQGNDINAATRILVQYHTRYVGV